MNPQDTKPAAVKPIIPPIPTADQVPDELRPLKRWVCWKPVWDPKGGKDHRGKWKKPPFSSLTGEALEGKYKSEERKAHYVTFEEAVAAAQKYGLPGVGFVFVAGDGFIGCDFDDCRDAGTGVTHLEVVPWLNNWFKATYAEISPSGTGVHVLCRGAIAKSLPGTPLPKAEGVTVEVYDSGRYFTFTGQRLPEHEFAVADRQISVEKLLAHLGEKTASGSAPRDGEQRAMSKFTARKIHQDNLNSLRHATDGQGNATLNTCAFFAGRAFAAGALEGTEETVKKELLDIVLKEWKHPHPEHGARGTVDSGWSSGFADPLKLIKSDKVFGDLRSEFLAEHARTYYREAELQELDEQAESVLYLELSRINNRRCSPPLPRSALRKLSVALSEQLSGLKAPTYPGMLEDEEQPNSDVGFGKHFARSFGDLVRYNAEKKEWLTYKLGVWRVDHDRIEVRKYLKEFFLAQHETAKQLQADLWPEWEPLSPMFSREGKLFKEYADEVTPEQREIARAWFEIEATARECRDGQSVKRLMSGIESAETEGLALNTGAWDADPLILNLKNATLDLATGDLVSNRRGAFCTLAGGVNFDDGASCPLFEEALKVSLPDENVRAFLQDFFGLSLSGLMTPEILIFLGEGANGKGLLLRIMAGVLGDYYKKTSMNSFLSAKFVSPGGARSDLAALRGKRLVSAAEANRKLAIDMELLKDWTGGEDFDARDVYEKAKNAAARPQGKLVLAMNKPPKIVDTTHAAWRRLRYVNFNVIIPKEQQNEYLADELLAAEGAGILNWMRMGWDRVRTRLAEKKPALVAPQVVLDATVEYKEKENQAARFFEDEIVLNLEGKVTSDALYSRYKGWCNRNGEFPMNAQLLILELKRHCSDQKKTVDWGGHNHHAGWHHGFELRALGSAPSEGDEMPGEEPFIPFNGR